MTLASLAPLLLYQVFNFSSNGENKFRPLAMGAYACYWVSQFIVYLLSRTREYMADQFSARVTGAPEQLSSALMKIAYGMVQATGEIGEALANASGEEKKRHTRAGRMANNVALMGIANFRSAEALALAPNAGSAAAIMRWDLVNPWARVYELSSTHPLSALLIQALNRQAENRNHEVLYPLPDDQRIQWGRFPLELFLWAAPFVFGCGAFLFSQFAPTLLFLCGTAWLLRIWLRYSGTFRPATVQQLLEDVAVSQMTPRAVRLEGTVIGFGVPGAFWCPDLVIRDESGMMYMLYRQSIPMARLLFAISGADSYIGQKVVLEGWYRRGLRPYVEMATLRGEDGKQRRTYSRWIQYSLAAATMLAAFVLLYW